MEALFTFLSQYIELTEADKDQIRAANIIKSFAKAEKIRRFDQQNDDAYFVLTGLVYTEYHVGEKTVVGDFFEAGQPVVVPRDGIGKELPYELTSLEESSLMVGSEQAADEFIAKFPKFEAVCFPYAQHQMAAALRQQLQAKGMTPAERYQEFIKARPALAEKVPGYLVASYLGVTPESLSRVRSRLAAQGN